MSWRFWFRARQFVRGSLWLIPVLGGVVGWACAVLAADTGTWAKLPSSWTYSPGTAQAVLAAVVGASVALTGFVVTVAVLIVQMATGTFSARYMRLFYRDRVLKSVLAVLVGTLTFSYGLMRRIEAGSVPSFGVTLAGFFLATGVGLFLVFLNRAIHRLRPVAVAALVAKAGRQAFDEALASALEPGSPEYSQAPYEAAETPSLLVHARPAGAIQAIDDRGLVRFARERACLVVLPKAAGDFVPEGAVLAEVYGGSGLGPGDEDRIRSMIALGVERTIEQDPAFAIRVMVDIAIRALSPAVNDPTTAVQVLDHLGDTLRMIGSVSWSGLRPTPERAPDSDVRSGRVIVRTRRWEDIVSLAITEIREYGGSSIQVMRRLRALLEELLEIVPEMRRPAIEDELARLDATIAEHWTGSVDLDRVRTADRQGIGGAGAAVTTAIS
jgi:uncharacterized membrane protein